MVKLSYFLCISIVLLSHVVLSQDVVNGNCHYYATSADQRFFSYVVRLINSILKNDAANVQEVAVFDLGFTADQRAYLTKMYRVKVCDIEMVHPDLLTHFLTSPHGRIVRGWFAWKPVAIKQALDMYPYILYLDAALEVLKPLNDVFNHIKQKGYFLVDAGPYSTIEGRVTKPVIESIISQLPADKQRMLLEKDRLTISAGIQGLARSVYDNYVLPVYHYASDLRLFADDGTARLGFGSGRHDQIIFSIYAYLNGMKVYSEGWMNLLVDGKEVPVHMHWDRNAVIKDTALIY